MARGRIGLAFFLSHEASGQDQVLKPVQTIHNRDAACLSERIRVIVAPTFKMPTADKSDRCHPGGQRPFDAMRGILDHDAIARRTTNHLGCQEKQVRRGFAMFDLVRAAGAAFEEAIKSRCAQGQRHSRL